MRVDPHTFAEGFIPEDFFKSQARARGIELGAADTTSGHSRCFVPPAHAPQRHPLFAALHISAL